MSTSDELTGGAKRTSRDAILDAAYELMAERGYAGTSISAICAASGLPPSSVYWHFHSKEGVLQAVLDRSARHYLAEFGAPDTAGATRDERLDKVLGAIANFVATASNNFHFLMVLGLREGRATELTTAVLRRVRGHIIGWLRAQLADIFGVDEHAAGELAVLVVTVANGVQIGRWVQGEEAPFPAGQLKIALTALAGAARPS
jgi:AcrR family transcriptional regulator